MANIEKFDTLAGYAFENALRYHFDSITCYEHHSFATAYQLSLLASEELGKAIMLNEYVWQYSMNGWRDKDPMIKKWLESIFMAHTIKHGWFARSADDFFNSHPGLRKASPIIRSLLDGTAEEEKQRSTYVGLTKKGKKVDLNGKITVPRFFAQPIKSEKQITLNNDFLVVYLSGFLRGVYNVDSYAMAQEMTRDYLEQFLEAWARRGRVAKKLLKDHEVVQFVKNPLSDWEN
jgi:AbiV family abortive infection protein